MINQRTIAVAGAGSIGCFVGGLQALSGRKVALLARPRLRDEIAGNGLTLTSFEGLRQTVAANAIEVSDDPAVALAGAGHVLVAVKSADTAAMAKIIVRHAPDDCVIVSLQNGIGNTSELKTHLPNHTVLPAMVPFNVVALGEGRFHRATSGDIQIARDPADSAGFLSVTHLAFRARDDIEAVQWGKLLINLNNALVALSDLTLKQELAQRPWRKLFADQITEALAAMRAEGIKPVSPTPIPIAVVARLLRLPDALFELILGRSMKVDPQARSSMWEDLARHRQTEIDYLQGVVIALAQRHGLPAPVSARVRDAIKAAEQAGRGPPGLRPADLMR